MSSGAIAAMVVLFLVVAIVAVVVSAIAAAKRREEMATYAAGRGWTYVEDEPRLVDRFGGSPFGVGFGRKAFNVIHGRHDERDFTSFDYVYKTQQSNGKTTTTVTHPFSVLAMSTTLPMPPLSVDPEGLFDSVADAVSGNAIDLELEEFNQAFTVRCPDRKFASDVLHPQMMEFLLANRSVGWRFERDSLLVVAKGKRSPGQIDATLAFMDGVTDRIPEFVLMRLRGQGVSTVIWVVVGIVVVLLVGLVASYNRFVRQRTLVEESWGGIDVELTRRHELIPNLVETVRGYAAHERELLELLVGAREAATAHRADRPQERGPYEASVTQALDSVLARVEAYPDLKASAGFLALQRELTLTEDRIAASRRFYNANVRAYNTRVGTVPSNLVASAFGFERRDFFELADAARAPAPGVGPG